MIRVLVVAVARVRLRTQHARPRERLRPLAAVGALVVSVMHVVDATRAVAPLLEPARSLASEVPVLVAIAHAAHAVGARKVDDTFEGQEAERVQRAVARKKIDVHRRVERVEH